MRTARYKYDAYTNKLFTYSDDSNSTVEMSHHYLTIFYQCEDQEDLHHCLPVYPSDDQGFRYPRRPN